MYACVGWGAPAAILHSTMFYKNNEIVHKYSYTLCTFVQSKADIQFFEFVSLNELVSSVSASFHLILILVTLIS